MTLLWIALASAGLRSFEIQAMSTRIEVILEDDARAGADAAEVFTVFRQVEHDANEWREGSPLAEVNAHAGGAAMAVPPPTYELVRRAVELGRETDGAFDLTWAALWGLWNFDVPAVPDPAAIRARLPLIDYRKVELGEGTVRLPVAGMRIGLGGIAKGWALDLAQRRLRALGRVDFMLSAGGQVYAAGHRDGAAAPWRVGVRDPMAGPNETLAVLAITDASVSTSGDYERYFELGGVRYHHILDPHTGMPARGLHAATVVSPDATRADALSTALMVDGPVAGIALAERLGVEALTIDELGRVRSTPGLPVVAWRNDARP